MLKVAFFLVAIATLLEAQFVVTGSPSVSQNLASPAARTLPEQRCAVQGQVTSAQTGEPLKKAHVYLLGQGKNNGPAGQRPGQKAT